ncbi:hypothetical protein ACRC7T_06400 [Segnochrobactraceae bacterium EtOH-i3]
MQMQEGTASVPRQSSGETDRTLKLAVMARAALNRSDGDVVAATNALCRDLSDVKTLRSVVSDVVAITAHDLVSTAMRSDRQAILRRASAPLPDNLTPSDPNGRARVEAFARAMAGIMDYPLSGGLKLRNATRADLVRQAAIHASFASDHNAKARWFSALADRTPEGATVGSILAPDVVITLYNENVDA